MDVTCERCGTEYEFDETLVSDRGTTVKCTHCGHLFKVYRPGSGPEAGEGGQAWQVRRSGRIEAETLASLRELQRRITRGELTESDEISRSGEGWKRLGDIAELQTFFAAARAAQEELRGAGRRDPTPPRVPSAPKPPARQPSDRPTPPPAQTKQTLFGIGGKSPRSAPPPAVPAAAGPPPAPAPARTPPPPAPPRKEPAPQAKPSVASAPPRAQPPASDRPAPLPSPVDRKGKRPAAPTKPLEPPRAPRTSEGRVAPPSSQPPRAPEVTEGRVPTPGVEPARPLHVEAGDEPAVAPAGRRRGLWLTLILLLAVGGGIALAWDRIAPLVGMGATEDPLAGFRSAGDQALARDDIASYEEAIREYTKASALAERDPIVLASLARAHAAWSQALSFQAADLMARAGDDPTLRGQAAAVREDQRRHADQARRYAEDATRLDPAQLAATLALADALRLSGDRQGARRHLDRAREMAVEPNAELAVTTALLRMDEADGDLTAAREDAQQAVELDPGLIRARILLARALLASGDTEGARAQLLAARDSTRAQALLDAIDRGVPPAAPQSADGGASADAGPPDTGPAEPTPPVAETPTPAGPDTPGTGPTPEPGGDEVIPRGRDYDWYIRRAEGFMDSGAGSRARSHYEAALEVRPGGAEALVGLGYLSLNAGDAAGAARRFEPAARAGFADAYIGLGDAYRRMGRAQDALRAYQSYLERRPSGPRASIAQRHIDLLREHLGQGGDQGGDTPDPTPPDTPPPSDTPPTPPDELPAPRGTNPANPPPSSDPPAVGTEP